MVDQVMIECVDSYRAIISFADLSAAFTHRKRILAARRDGAPMTASERPSRLAVEGEKRMVRSVR
jgi:hypothetical protein